jgi:hypothetical protein
LEPAAGPDLQKPWIARNLQVLCKSLLYKPKYINALIFAPASFCKFLFGGFLGFQGLAGEKIWKCVFSENLLSGASHSHRRGPRREPSFRPRSAIRMAAKPL